MAKINATPEQSSLELEKKRLNEEKKKLKAEQKAQKKEAKKRAKEIAKQESALADETEGGGAISGFLITVIIIAIWLAILCLLIKLDVGGFGSGVLRPILQDIPVVQMILPEDNTTETEDATSYYGYTSLRDAVEQIRVLELELEQAQSLNNADTQELAELRAEVARLQEFEENQTEFARIRQQFYEEVVYAENGPGAEEYRAYFEEMDPTTAEYIYRQVVLQDAIDQQLQDYASAYSAMKPKAAASIFESMEDDLELVAKILNLMSAEDRGNILGAMDSEIAARVTKIMDPNS